MAPSCEGAKTSDVFKGSTVAHFSYEACGNLNCYSDPKPSGCPNDVNGDQGYKPEKAGPATDDACKCKYNDAVGLPQAILDTNAAYKALANSKYYGTVGREERAGSHLFENY